MNIIIGNILSFAGGLLDFLLGLKYNEKIKILKGNLVSSSLSLISYICLEAYDGVIDCIVTLLRLFTIYIKEKYHKKFKFLFIGFFLCYCLVFFKFSGFQTIILFLSSMCSFIPKWMSKNMQVIRGGAFCANILAIIYDLMIGNYAVISIRAINIALLVVTITKWARKGKKAKK
jgi:hypothetical protein